ncbi:unnamed protein product [Triticum turgidum subsp. durum]|uniref:Phytocyanin domain-containing protein n=1 Tax=Triticum turgidum subsp. durum TaxID=4567 RepID=A0A9R1S8I4_TRITD|nr:unnamed protein product [Triticum turgidum subsp. durum]
MVLVVLCPTASAAPKGKQYKVGGPEGWRVPPKADKEMAYVKWASNITFFVGDSVGFVYFASSNLGHCKDGQKLLIKVLDPEQRPPASASSPLESPTDPSSSEAPPSPEPGPASTEHSSAMGGPFVASLARAMAQAATLVLACFI